MLHVQADFYHPAYLHSIFRRERNNVELKYFTPSKVVDVSSQMDMEINGLSKSGENHGDLNVPDGSEVRTISVDGTGADFPAYFTKNANEKKATHAFIIFHGRWRDGDRYWSIMNDAYHDARKDKFPHTPKHAIVVAPQFFSAKLNKGQYRKSSLAWDDNNAWQSGSVAVHPEGTDVSSMDAVDALVDYFSDEKRFPNMKNLTLVGHGGGGQLINRYATVGKDASRKGIHVRYIVGDPSSSAYFTYHRPVTDKRIASVENCPSYNNWRYGFDTFPGTRSSNERPDFYYKRYIRRDVVNIVGERDVSENGDQKCMAVLQGGKKRRDRNLSWWRYINMIGGTNENLHGFPGNFSDLPDWSHHSNGIINTRLTIVPDASHSAKAVFGGKHGRSALFDPHNVEMGWRPDGWKYKAPKIKLTKKPEASNSDSDSDSVSKSSSFDEAEHTSTSESKPHLVDTSRRSNAPAVFLASGSASQPLSLAIMMIPVMILPLVNMI